MPFLQMFAETLTTTLCASVAIQSDCPSDVAAVVEQLQHNKKCGPGRHDERRVDDVAARAAGPRGHLLAGVGVDDAQRPHLFRRRAIGRPRQRERCRRQQPDGPISGRPNAPKSSQLACKAGPINDLTLIVVCVRVPCVAERRRTTSGTHRCIWQRRTGTRTS